MDGIHIDEERIVKELKSHLKKREMYKGLLVVGILIFLIPVIIVFVLDKPILILLAALGAIVGSSVVAVAVVLYLKAEKDYLLVYKQTIARPILQAMFKEVLYIPQKGFTSQEFKDMHLRIWNGSQYKSEDYIKGKCKGVAFRQADVEIVRASESKRKIYEVNGQLREFEYAKPIEGMVLLGNRGSHLDVQPGMHRIEFENVEFNRKFDVYAEDEHSAFLLITPQFMEYLMRISQFDEEVYMSFDGEKLRLLQSEKGGVFNPQGDLLNVSAHIENARNDLEQIEAVINILHIGN